MKNMAYDKGLKLATRVVAFCRTIEQDEIHYYLRESLLHSGTNVGSLLAQACGTSTEIDFSDMVSQANKACYETLYWLALLKDAFPERVVEYNKLRQNAKELAQFLHAILKSTNRNIF